MSITQRTLLACALSVTAGLWFVACGDDEDDSDDNTITDESGLETGPEIGDREHDPGAEIRAALRQRRVHLDLLAQAHLADIDHGGLYLDFGTPARMHYTMGRWRSGFLRDVTAGERDFTRVGTDARAWFHLDTQAAVTLRFRARPIGSDAFVVYLNGQRAGQVDFAGQGVQEHDISVAETLVREGENTLMLRAANTRAVQGEDIAYELDSIWVRGASPGEAELTPPRYASLVRELEVGGDGRSAVVLPRSQSVPTVVRWYAEVPEDAELSFGVGVPGDEPEGDVSVRVTAEGGQPNEVFAGELLGRWHDQLIALEGLAGEIVRVEFTFTGGEGPVGISAPQIVVPLPEQALDAAQSESVIVLLIDTLRASKLRVYNPRSRVQTPTLQAFADEGAVFENAQSPENWTKPSVASILTSLTPTTHNTKEQSSSLPESALMVSEVFQQNDFATASFIANGYVSDRYGFNQGWDHYTNYIREERNTEARTVFREALAWIREHRGERFFAYIQTIDPHVPYDPPDAVLETYFPGNYDGPINNRSTGILLESVKAGNATLTRADQRRLMALHDAEITYHDQEMETFLDGLRELGIYDEILFVVTSDHGEEFNEHGSWGHGHSIFQELLHVPLIMRWNGAIPPTRIAPTVSTMDIAPTILEATGVDIPDEYEGQSLLASARGRMRSGPAIAFSDKLDDRRVATASGFKLVIRHNLTWAIFNLRTDPNEEHQIDSGGRYPIALRYLRGLYGQHLGADDRGNWLHAGTGAEARVLPAAESQIDAELCRQLLELDYIDPRCAELL